MQKIEWFRTGLIAAFAVMSAVICARLLLRNLSFFLQFDPQFSAIFAQISDSHMYTPIGLMLLTTAGYLLLYRLSMKQKWKAVSVLCGMLLWVFTIVSAVLLTKVNGIRFCDVLFSLLDVMAKGVL